MNSFNGFIVLVFIGLLMFCFILWLFSLLARISFSAWVVLVNLGLLGLFGYIVNNGTNVVVTVCVYLFIATVVNLTVINTHHETSTKEGREKMLRQIEAQKEYDRKYRNYVKEAKDKKVKKGTIEFTEKKR